MLLNNHVLYDIFNFFIPHSDFINSTVKPPTFLEFGMILEFRKGLIRCLQEVIYPFESFLSLALKKATSDPRLISIYSRTHLRPGEGQRYQFLKGEHPIQ